MASNNIMQDIRDLLSQGRSSAEVIALGFKPPTVYKVQRQLSQGQQSNGRAPVQLMDQSIIDREGQEELSTEDAEFFRCLFEPADDTTQTDSLRTELDQARDRIEELEAEAGKVQVLQEKVDILEAEAEACVELRRRLQELQAGLRQGNAQWQTKVHVERLAREQTERRVEEHRVQTRQLRTRKTRF